MSNIQVSAVAELITITDRAQVEGNTGWTAGNVYRPVADMDLVETRV